MPADDDDVEADNLDEAIVLAELFLMADDDLKQFFSALPQGVHATVVTDCCHSGTLLDGTEVVIEGAKDEDSAAPQAESDALLETLGGSRGYEVSASRSLPIETICSIMSQKLGSDVPPTSSGVNGAMAHLFGGTAGKFMFKFAMSQLAKQDDGGGSGMTSTLASLLSGSGPGGRTSTSSYGNDSGGGGGLGMLGGMVSSFLGGGQSDNQGNEGNSMPSISSVLGNIGLEPSSDVPQYNPHHGKIQEDVCALVTGCQAHETSADVRPPDGDAYGALTKTLTDVARENENISYYDLVMKVRQVLSAGGFQQNPCLEMSEDRAHSPFICEV